MRHTAPNEATRIRLTHSDTGPAGASAVSGRPSTPSDAVAPPPCVSVVRRRLSTSGSPRRATTRPPCAMRTISRDQPATIPTVPRTGTLGTLAHLFSPTNPQHLVVLAPSDHNGTPFPGPSVGRLGRLGRLPMFGVPLSPPVPPCGPASDRPVPFPRDARNRARQGAMHRALDAQPATISNRCAQRLEPDHHILWSSPRPATRYDVRPAAAPRSMCTARNGCNALKLPNGCAAGILRAARGSQHAVRATGSRTFSDQITQSPSPSRLGGSLALP